MNGQRSYGASSLAGIDTGVEKGWEEAEGFRVHYARPKK